MFILFKIRRLRSDKKDRGKKKFFEGIKMNRNDKTIVFLILRIDFISDKKKRPGTAISGYDIILFGVRIFCREQFKLGIRRSRNAEDPGPCLDLVFFQFPVKGRDADLQNFGGGLYIMPGHC